MMYICDIYEISFVCLDGIGKTNKKVCTGHFVECNTRQSTSLPSIMALALDKEARFAECHTKHSAKYLTWDPSGGFFAECCQADTRQR
jgi:hypothetical protein